MGVSALFDNAHFEKFFKNSIKLLRCLFSILLQTFYTHRELKGDLGSQRALERHSKGT